MKDGRCDPSYDAIQKRTGFCRQTIAKGLKALASCRLITITRRLAWKLITRVSPITGEMETIKATVQGTNMYVFDPNPKWGSTIRPRTRAKVRPFPKVEAIAAPPSGLLAYLPTNLFSWGARAESTP